MLSFIVLLLSTQLGLATHQVVFKDSFEYDTASSYEFKWPIRKVAVIGAGVSGLISYRELRREGFDVHLYERDSVPGGNWHYTDEIPLDAPVPNNPSATGDYSPSLPPKGVHLPYVIEYREGTDGTHRYVDKRRAHRGPRPMWKSLASNAPATFQEIRELPWPKDAPLELPHLKLQQYLRSYASYLGINSNDENSDAHYDTRVELVEKHFLSDGTQSGWKLTLKKLEKTSETSFKETWSSEVYDAVVVATGTFNAPNMPDIAGLDLWKNRFPKHISHSRDYRHPDPFANKTVLIVGSSASGTEISRELIHYAKKVYQSIRPAKSKNFFTSFIGLHKEKTISTTAVSSLVHRTRIPANTTVIGEIENFEEIAEGDIFADGVVHLKNGTVLSGIDHIIFATGFQYTFPFIPQYHSPDLGRNETAPEGEIQPIVTDGSHVRSLHLDTFYIEEPTIGFMNQNTGMQSFLYAEYQAAGLAKVWSNRAKLPTRDEMWRLHLERLLKYGEYDRDFQRLGLDGQDAHIRYFVGWLNEAAVRNGGNQIELAYQNLDVLVLWSYVRFGNLRGVQGNTTSSVEDYPATKYNLGIDGSLPASMLFDSLFHGDW